MNADTADTQSPHLDIEDLLAGITGDAATGRTVEHLAACARCRAESKRWHLVADAIHGLAADAPQGAPPARPRHMSPPVHFGREHRTIPAVGAAAAILLIGGASYAASAILAGHGHGPGPAITGMPSTGTASTGTASTGTAALTAVSGCAALRQTAGTLDQVGGTSLTITTAGGQKATVTTTAATMMTVSGAALADITDGTPVTVAGRSSDGTIAAQSVVIGTHSGASGKRTLEPPGLAAVSGTATDVGGAGFSVLTGAGSRVPVTTSTATDVEIPFANLSQLQIGVRTIAVGHAGPNGTLSAIAVLQPPQKLHAKGLQVMGCSSAAVDDAITAALITGG